MRPSSLHIEQSLRSGTAPVVDGAIRFDRLGPLEVLAGRLDVSDVEERTKLYEQAQVVFKEQAPWATIAHSIVFKPVRKEVVDFKIDPFGGHIFYGVDLK